MTSGRIKISILAKIFGRIAKYFQNVRRLILFSPYKILCRQHRYRIARNEKRSADLNYLVESPEVLKKWGVDVGKLKSASSSKKAVFSTFDLRVDGATLSKNISYFYCLCDRFASMPEDVPCLLGREQKAVLLRSSNRSMEGHQLRHEFDANEYLDVVELDGSQPDLTNIYSKYKYAVVIENCRSSGYVSEKFFDAVKAGCEIFYFGDIFHVRKLGFLGIRSIEEVSGFFLQYRAAADNAENPALYAEENFKRLVKLREETFLEVFSFPAIFLITGEK